MKTKTPFAIRWMLNILLIAGLLASSVATLTQVSAQPAAPAPQKQTGLSDEGDPSDYWTPERMASAIPYDVLPGSAASQAVTTNPAQAAAIGTPGWKPSHAPDGFTGTIVTTGQAGTYPAPIPTNAYTSGYVPGSDIHTFPYSASGKVYFTMAGRNYACSASVIGEYTIWTAGHCVNNGRGTFHSNWVYVPVFDNYTSAYPGPWLASYYVAPIEFTHDMNLSHDYAIVGVMPPAQANGRSIRSYTGALGFAWNMPRAQKWELLGYPMIYFDGIHMVYSDSTYWADNPRFTPPSVGVGSNIKSGGSGGPWILNEMTGKAGQANYLNGTNSYISATADEVYSPYLDDRAKQLWDCSQGATPALDWNCFKSSAIGNLTLSYIPSSDPATPNAPFSYQINIHNPGPADATGVVLTDSASLIGASLHGGSCNIVGATATCTLASLPAGDTASATLTVSAQAAYAGSIDNIAKVTFDQQEKWDTQVTFSTAISCFKQVTVTNTNNSGAGSLRDALASVCNSGSIIDFDPGLSGGTIHLASQLEAYSIDVTIDGSNLPERLTLSGAGTTRVLNSPTTILTLDSLIITRGRTGDNGGGIYASSLILNNSSVTDNRAAYGGGVYVDYTLTIVNSTFSGNTASADGGGIYDYNGQLTLTNSTLSGNSATNNGGGIYCDASILTAANSTIFGNTAGTDGGGIYSQTGSVSLTNATLSGNSASGQGGGIYLNGGTLDYVNTLIANSTSGGDCVNNGTLGTSTSNLVEDGTCSAAQSGDPLLGPLADNGGPTRTMALLPSSPALNAGDDAACPATDRGASRPEGAHCNIGAFELDATPPTVVFGSGTVPANGQVLSAGPATLSVQFNEAVKHDGSGGAANNPFNYLLFEDGANKVFDTPNCMDGVWTDDTGVVINSVTYDPATFTATLTINDGAPLLGGTYRLLACGTTSIENISGLKLNGGLSDTSISFTVSLPVALPSTGFAPNRVTELGGQATQYKDLGDLWLEIPRLGVKMNILGVPQANGEWDVSWLGSNAGWLNGSAFPTGTGNSVLTGHVVDAYGQAGPFRYLNTLWWGDKVIVHAGDAQYVYEVRAVTQVSPGNVSAMLKHEELPWLTLVTCRGYDQASNSYQYRVLVRAVLVEVK